MEVDKGSDSYHCSLVEILATLPIDVVCFLFAGDLLNLKMTGKKLLKVLQSHSHLLWKYLALGAAA